MSPDALVGSRWAQHNESSAVVAASPERVFALLDDHERLAWHMSQSSWRMGAGRMKTILDESRGKRVGSHIRVSGRVLGLELSLDEVVTERDLPTRKAWEADLAAGDYPNDGMSCDGCVRDVRRALGQLPGVRVEQVEVGYATVTFDADVSSREAIGNAIRGAGAYRPRWE